MEGGGGSRLGGGRGGGGICMCDDDEEDVGARDVALARKSRTASVAILVWLLVVVVGVLSTTFSPHRDRLTGTTAVDAATVAVDVVVEEVIIGAAAAAAAAAEVLFAAVLSV